MPEHLVFTLASAIGALGDLAGHERRGGALWPGRSAVLGLVAAAMGLRRDDAAGLAELDRLGVAVGQFDAGRPLRDFHTVQTVPSAAARRPDSRRAALREAGRRVNTTITLRDYRADPLHGVALWGEGPPLDAIRAALLRPHFHLYFGRKSCPLSAPAAPRILDAPDPVEALRQTQLPPWRDQGLSLVMVASDPAPGLPAPNETRFDRATDRERWHFASRPVVTLTPPAREDPS